jgi:hypothetical protein
MIKFNIIEGAETSIQEVFRTEPKFTDDFLINPEEFKKVLSVIGINENIELIEKQYPTSDGKSLDLFVTLESGQRIGLEAQIGTSDMTHIAKLPYYLDNIRDKDEAESVIGILMAESFTQEAIDFYTTLNELPHFDLYLVKCLLIKVGDAAVFMPQLNYPTPTTNNYKKFKKSQIKESGAYVPNEKVKNDICEFLEKLSIPYKVRGPYTRGFYDVRFKQKEYELSIWVRPTGSISLCGMKNHINEEIFENKKELFRLKANNPLCKSIDEFTLIFNKFIENL